jgi:Na+-driven multidrug efflux pump
VIVGALIAALSGVLGIVYTGDPDVSALVQPALIVLAVAQPIAGVVFVLDGVLMGANDAKYLAIAGGLNLVPFLPALWIIAATGVDGAAGLIWLAVAFFGIYLLARLGTLGWRVRSGRWVAVEA